MLRRPDRQVTHRADGASSLLPCLRHDTTVPHRHTPGTQAACTCAESSVRSCCRPNAWGFNPARCSWIHWGVEAEARPVARAHHSYERVGGGGGALGAAHVGGTLAREANSWRFVQNHRRRRHRRTHGQPCWQARASRGDWDEVSYQGLVIRGAPVTRCAEAAAPSTFFLAVFKQKGGVCDVNPPL
jgi:hypothetical protein